MSSIGSGATAARGAVEQALRGRRVDVKGKAFELGLLAALGLSLLILLVLLYDVFSGGLGVLTERGGEFLRGHLSPIPATAGVGQGIQGSFLMMVFVVALAFPVGIGAAIYLEEYARDTPFTRFVNVNIRNLAGVPSIVYGILGFSIFVQVLGGLTGGESVMAGGVTLAVLVLPIVIITTAEALRAVPDSIREAGYGVGATRWEVVRSHVLPSAAPGILTGTVLSLSRALGETAPLLLVGAVTGFLATGSQSFVEQIQGPFTALPTIVFSWARQPNAAFRELTSAAIVVLLVVILVANAAAIFLRNRYDRKW
ncbi:MAG TPA: phosphate ABC transporter permease PstA [Actinomycetota bacterium]|nr:phosphate ABC transporter permease PstA [Actinomycetota bacterium]